jgi:hypothetical protein
MQSIVIIVDYPLSVVCEFGVASLELLKFSGFGRVVRYPDRVGIFHCFGAVLLSGEHGGPFCQGALRYPVLRLAADNRIELFRGVFKLRKHFECVLRSARQNDLVVDKFQIVIRDNNQMRIHAKETTDR